MNQTSTWALTAAGFFLVGFGLIFVLTPEQATASPLGALAYLQQLCFLAFHLCLFPVVANLVAPTWAKGAGYAWLVVDNVVVVMTILGVGAEITQPMRLGVHIAAGTWILLASLSSTNNAVKYIGAVAGVWIGGYSLVAPYVPATLFYPAGILLLVWCATIGFTSRATPATSETAAPTV